MTTVKPNLIVGLGEVLWDLFPSDESSSEKPSDKNREAAERQVYREVPICREVLGGAPLNFTWHASSLGDSFGWKGAVASRIGQDRRGQLIQDLLLKRQLATDALQLDSKHPTGTVEVQLHHGEPTYTITLDSAWDFMQFDLAWSTLAKRTALVCFGTLAKRSPGSRQAIDTFLEHADSALKLLDLNLRAPWYDREVILDSLRRADVLKLNNDEIRIVAEHLEIAGQHTEEELAALIKVKGNFSAVMLTRGARGCYLVNNAGTYEGTVEQLPQAPNADAVGAGDAAAAALGVGLLENWDGSRIVATANRFGAYVASQAGATPEIPSLAWILG